MSQWMKREISRLNVVATYNLLFNASLLVDEGLGYALCFDKLINTQGSNLCFRPFFPEVGSVCLHCLEKISGVLQSGGNIFGATVQSACN